MASNTARSPIASGASGHAGTPAVRLALRVDALACAATGALLAAASPWLTGLLGYPVPFLAGVGLFLVAFAGFLARLAARDRVAPSAVRFVVAFNAAWIIASALLALSGAMGPTLLGAAAVALQAAALAPITVAEALTLRRAR
ncbi:hypothetical protein O4J56_04115 [Nocardiopsis sp. RSe5-2]|uniref:Integral membrane protein n=1 Tax=Nocardiopsis endophytica TaxID=3018445 RepID=A0ABT4TYP6_9ACTN|nr:hypothetical protein [Nocardiopsis endophytica]MDA2809815.1 hypothetical protein [Nocardiopsis endophytica]